MFEIDSFGFFVNNIIYVVLGFKMGYWGFFFVKSDNDVDEVYGFGIVFVWGFVIVKVFCYSDIKVGEKVFGYLFMVSYWVIKVGKVVFYGFLDIYEKWKSISFVYD